MNYPSGLKKKENSPNSKIHYEHRGMTLEGEINDSNKYYQEIDKAYIYKKPTPVKIVKVNYPSRDKAKITEAYFTVPSTTDYNGIYKGYYIDFEAKETKSETSFTLANIHQHQIKHLENMNRHGGISFLIVRFTILNETYLLTTEKLIKFLNNTKRKSIPIQYFKENAYLIKDGYNPRIDYLKIIDSIMEESKWQKQKK